MQSVEEKCSPTRPGPLAVDGGFNAFCVPQFPKLVYAPNLFCISWRSGGPFPSVAIKKALESRLELVLPRGRNVLQKNSVD